MNADQLIHQLRAPNQRGLGRVEDSHVGAPNIERLTALDEGAISVRSWDAQVVPGLLQTGPYAASVLAAANPNLSSMEVRRRTLLKSARTNGFLRRLLNPRSGLEGAYFVVSEAAIIHCVSGHAQVHADQLNHLLRVSMMRAVDVVVLPGHKVIPSFASHFLLYRLDGQTAEESVARVGYVETVIGGYYSTRLEDVARMHNIYSDMAHESMSPRSSREFIREVLSSWTSTPSSETESHSGHRRTQTTTVSEWREQQEKF